MINLLLSIQSQLKILHWHTTSYARHMAFGSTYEALDELFDTFVEAYKGRYGTLDTVEEIPNISLNVDSPEPIIDSYITTFSSQEIMESWGIDPTATDLFNLRDEIINCLQKLKYLLTLN